MHLLSFFIIGTWVTMKTVVNVFVAVFIIIHFCSNNVGSSPAPNEDSLRENLISYIRTLLKDREENEPKRTLSILDDDEDDDDVEEELHMFARSSNGTGSIIRNKAQQDNENNEVYMEITSENATMRKPVETVSYDHHSSPNVVPMLPYKRSFYVQEKRLWPGGQISYVIDASVNSQMNDLILQAINQLESQTCLRFNDETGNNTITAHMRFIDQSNRRCSANIGYPGDNGVTVISMDGGTRSNGSPYCASIEVVLHEIMHGIGMLHNQQRSDRDGRIKIEWANIDDVSRNNFDLEATENEAGPFDLESVLQYRPTIFNKTASDTMTVPDERLKHLMWTRHTDITFYDAMQINSAYKCATGCTNNCENGGFKWKNSTIPCECRCPNEYLSGATCQSILTTAICGSNSITTFTAPGTKTLTVDNYQSGKTCAYLVKAPNNYRINGKFTKLGLPKSSSCTHHVEVRYSLLGQEGVSFCGDLAADYPSGITFSTDHEESNMLMVILNANIAATVGTGFEIELTAYLSGCKTMTCYNGGTCEDDPSTGTSSCQCATGYGGADCNEVGAETVQCNGDTDTPAQCFLNYFINPEYNVYWKHSSHRSDNISKINASPDGAVYYEVGAFGRYFFGRPAELESTPTFSAIPRKLNFLYNLKQNTVVNFPVKLEVKYSSNGGAYVPLKTFTNDTNKEWVRKEYSIPAVTQLKIFFVGFLNDGVIALDDINLIPDVPTTTTVAPTTTTTTPSTTTAAPTTTTAAPTTTTAAPTTTTAAPTTTTAAPTTTTAAPTTTTAAPTTTTAAPTTTTAAPTTTTAAPTTTTAAPTTTTAAPTTTTAAPTTTTTTPTTTTAAPTTTTAAPTTTTAAPTITPAAPTTTTAAPTTTTVAPTTTTAAPTTTTAAPTTTTAAPTTTTAAPTTTTAAPTTTTVAPTTTTAAPTTTTAAPTTTTAAPTTTTVAPTTTMAAPTTTTAPPTTTTVAPTSSPFTGIRCNAETAAELSTCGFSQANDDDFDFSRRKGFTPSRGTGPQGAKQGDYYYYIEASVPRKQGDVAKLTTSVDLPETELCLSFWWNMRETRSNSMMGTLKVYVSGTTTAEYTAWQRTGRADSRWYQAHVFIPSTEGLKITIAAVVGAGFRSDIALDDIRINTDNCPELVCTFDVSPGYQCEASNDKDNTFYYQITRLPSVQYSRNRFRPFSSRVFASTFNRYYLNGKATINFDHEFDDSRERCVTFLYMMPGQNVGTLRLYAESVTDSSETTLIAVTGPQGDEWKMAAAKFEVSEKSKLRLEATTGNAYGYPSDIAIDDFVVYPYKCADVEFECIFSPESPCFIGNVKGDDADMIRKQGRTRSFYTGPDEAAEGTHYMYLEASGKREGTVAHLAIAPGLPDGTKCLSFKYHMYGGHIGSLSLIQDGTSLWSKTDNQGNDWLEASVTITLSGNYQVYFEAKRGEGYQSDIAVDHLELSPGACDDDDEDDD